MPTRKRSTPTQGAATRRRAPARTKAGSDFEKVRSRLDRKREGRRQKMMWAHYWLLCPKCGGDMFVQHTMGIAYEVCRECHGIAIDGEEAALLLEHLNPGKALRAILKKSRNPDTTET